MVKDNPDLKGKLVKSKDSPGIIGQGITIRGNLTGEEPLIIEGRVEGTITLRNHLTVEGSGIVYADIEAENLTIKGQVNGNIVVQQAVAILSSAKVVGNIKAPRIIIEEGALFKGGIEMEFELEEESATTQVPSTPVTITRRR